MTAGAEIAPAAAKSGGATTGWASGARDLPSAIPAFLEACGTLAAEAAARGDLTKVRDLVEKGARTAALYEGDASTAGTPDPALPT